MLKAGHDRAAATPLQTAARVCGDNVGCPSNRTTSLSACRHARSCRKGCVASAHAYALISMIIHSLRDLREPLGLATCTVPRSVAGQPNQSRFSARRWARVAA